MEAFVLRQEPAPEDDQANDHQGDWPQKIDELAPKYIKELMLQQDRTEFRVCGIVSNIAKKLSKKDNRPWAAFSLATSRGPRDLSSASPRILPTRKDIFIWRRNMLRPCAAPAGSLF